MEIMCRVTELQYSGAPLYFAEIVIFYKSMF